MCQNFEGAGYDNDEVWTESGTVNPDSTDNPGNGAECLLIDNVDVATTKSPVFQESGTIYLKFMIRLDTYPTNTVRRISLLDSTDDVCNLSISQNGIFVLYHGSSYAEGSTVMTQGTWYYVWLDYTKSSGANDGVASVYINTSDTKPTEAEASLSNGNSISDIRQFEFRSSNNAIAFDYVFLSDSL